MKLTNLQLNVLVKALYDRIDKKVEETLSKPSVYNKISDKVKKEMKYDKAILYAEESKSIQDQINDLSNSRNELNRRYAKEVLGLNSSYSSIPSVGNIKRILLLKLKGKDIKISQQELT